MGGGQYYSQENQNYYSNPYAVTSAGAPLAGQQNIWQRKNPYAEGSDYRNRLNTYLNRQNQDSTFGAYGQFRSADLNNEADVNKINTYRDWNQGEIVKAQSDAARQAALAGGAMSRGGQEIGGTSNPLASMMLDITKDIGSRTAALNKSGIDYLNNQRRTDYGIARDANGEYVQGLGLLGQAVSGEDQFNQRIADQVLNAWNKQTSYDQQQTQQAAARKAQSQAAADARAQQSRNNAEQYRLDNYHPGYLSSEWTKRNRDIQRLSGRQASFGSTGIAHGSGNSGLQSVNY
jgi:hypothetical protein